MARFFIHSVRGILVNVVKVKTYSAALADTAAICIRHKKALALGGVGIDATPRKFEG
jgi:hypothetical protein